MITIPPELATELSSEISFTCYMFDLELSTPIYYVNIDEDIWYNNNKYRAFPFNLNNVDLSLGDSVQSITIDFDTVGLELASIVLNQDIRGTNSGLWFAAIDNNLNVIGRLNLFYGFVSEVEFDDKKLQLTLMDEMSRWKDQTVNVHSPTCIWRFKDPNTCKYNGTETWCDKTYERCSYLGNTLHFRGFRFLPELQEKEIWWGRVPK